MTRTPLPTPTALPSLASRRVTILQSDGRVAIYREAAEAIAGGLGTITELHDLQGDRGRGLAVLDGEARNADLILAVGSLAATVAKERISDKPVLFCAVLNPERYDLRGKNVAGVRFDLSATAQLRRLREVLPGARRVGVIHDPAKSGAFIAEAERAAGALGLDLVPAIARDPREVAVVFRSIRADIDVLLLIPDATIVTRESFEVLLLQTAESKIPMAAFAEAFARQGALLALYPEAKSVGAQCAALATRTLRGELDPAKIGVQDPAKSKLAVNRRIEDRLGIQLAPGIQADVEIR